MKISSRPVRRGLKRELAKVHRIVDRIAAIGGTMASLCLAEATFETDLAHCEELTRPACDLVELWPTVQSIVGNVEPIGLANPARQDRPDLSAECLRSALAIIRTSLADQRQQLADLQERRNCAIADFARAVTAALAAGAIQLDPDDMAVSGDPEADGTRIAERVANFISPPPTRKE